MLSDSIKEDQFLTVESHGQIVGLAGIETTESPTALNFSFSHLRKYFSFTSALLRWIAHTLIKRLQVSMNLETFYISLLMANVKDSQETIYLQLIDQCDELARSLGKTTLVIEVSGHQEALHRVLKTAGFRTMNYRKSHLPILGKFRRRLGANGYFHLEKDLLGDIIF